MEKKVIKSDGYLSFVFKSSKDLMVAEFEKREGILIIPEEGDCQLTIQNTVTGEKRKYDHIVVLSLIGEIEIVKKYNFTEIKKKEELSGILVKDRNEKFFVFYDKKNKTSFFQAFSLMFSTPAERMYGWECLFKKFFD